jgi:hypothetical protein
MDSPPEFSFLSLVEDVDMKFRMLVPSHLVVGVVILVAPGFHKLTKSVNENEEHER